MYLIEVDHGTSIKLQQFLQVYTSRVKENEVLAIIFVVLSI